MTHSGWSSADVAASGRRPRLARLCRRSGLLPLAGRLRGLFREDVRILAYHRVLDSADPEGFSFDVDLISASADAFREQMKLAKRRFQPMRFDELADCLDRGRRPPPRALLVTFDDGYDDNHRIAFPILSELGLSAMFFVCTDHIASGMPYAYDWLVHMLCSTGVERLEVPELGLHMPLPQDLAGRRAIARTALDRIKTLDAVAQEALIARLEREWQLPRTQGHPFCRPMSWADLREMRRGGMEIGSHGIGHRMLAKLPPAEMRREVAGSREALERELGERVDVISYPVGGPDAYDEDVMHATRQAGYRLACSYRAGTDAATSATRYDMRRLPIERQMDASWFEAMMALPEAFSYRSRYRNR